MKIGVKEITRLSLHKMEEILEFRAFTQYSYLHFRANPGYPSEWQLEPYGKKYNQIQVCKKLEFYEATFLPQLSFQHAVSVFESWFFDVLRHILSDPNRLNKKRKIDVADVLGHDSLDELLEHIIEAELNEVKYKKPREWFDYLAGFVKTTVLSEDQVAGLAEIKASRDVLVHNAGLVNQTYLSKAGSLARATIACSLPFDHGYVMSSWTLLSTMMSDLGTALSEKIDP